MDFAAAASRSAKATTVVVVKKATARSWSRRGTIRLINDHAATPAAPNMTWAGPKYPGTARMQAAAIGASAPIASTTATRPDRARLTREATAVSPAMAVVANSPARSPVTAW